MEHKCRGIEAKAGFFTLTLSGLPDMDETDEKQLKHKIDCVALLPEDVKNSVVCV